jgi:hypothetical protein
MSLIETKAIASGSHAIIKTPPTESQEVQFNVSEPNPRHDGSIITATLKRPDPSAVLTNIGFCYRVASSSDLCMLPSIFPGLEEFRIYINGSLITELCGIHEIQSTWKELLLTENGDTARNRDNHLYSETGAPALDNTTGCFACVAVGPSASPPERMIHTFINRIAGPSFKELPMKNINELRIEFKLSTDSLQFSNSATAAQDIQYLEFQVWGTMRRMKNGAMVPRSPFGSYTMARERYDRYRYAPSAHPFANPNQEFQIQLSSIFPHRDPIVRVSVYGVDDASPDKYRCRVPVISDPPSGGGGTEIDIIEDGTSNACGTESSGLTGGKRGNEMHRFSSNLAYYSNKSVEVPTNPSDPNHNKAWSFDGIQTSKTATHVEHKKTNWQAQALGGKPPLDITGIHNKGNLQLSIKNGTNVLNATTSVIVEIAYLEFRRLGNSGEVKRIVMEKQTSAM